MSLGQISEGFHWLLEVVTVLFRTACKIRRLSCIAMYVRVVILDADADVEVQGWVTYAECNYWILRLCLVEARFVEPGELHM